MTSIIVLFGIAALILSSFLLGCILTINSEQKGSEDKEQMEEDIRQIESVCNQVLEDL